MTVKATVAESVDRSLLQSVSLRICDSFLLSPVRSIWDKNQLDAQLPLSKTQKVAVGLYLVARDWALGNFPPRFERESAWENERTIPSRVAGISAEQWYANVSRCPFGYHETLEHYLHDTVRIWKVLRQCKIAPPARILEIGCSTGWLSEILANMKFEVTGTTISPNDVAVAARRVAALREKDPDSQLTFDVSPMELVHTRHSGFDCVLVYEALHHAFDWRETIGSVARTLNPGGWFLICNEPNLVHTFVSYRISKLTTTHEVGISRRKLVRELHENGFGRMVRFCPRLHFGIGWHWLAAQKSQ